MNIYATSGHKVKVTEETATWGYDSDEEIVAKYLEVEKEYTVDFTDVGGSHTSVYLKEFPNISFNSVNFVDVIELTEEDEQEHPQYHMYNY